MSTTTTDAILPAPARLWVYRGSIVAGAAIFVAAIVLMATGHDVLWGITVDPETGVVGIVLAGLGTLAHVNLSSGSGVIKALEDLDPKVGEVVDAAQTTVEKAQELAAANPDLANMLRAELVTLLPAGVKPGKKTKAELVAIIEAASKTGA